MIQVPPTVSHEVAAEGEGYPTDSDDDAEREVTDETDPCQEETADGEVCGRERPCQYHD